MHDPTKLVLGTTADSDRVVTKHNADPASFPAGLAVKLPTDGTLSLSSGTLIGVSLGKSLSDTKKTAVCRDGNFVPMLLTDVSEDDSGDYTYVVPGAAVYVDGTTGMATDDSGTLTGAKWSKADNGPNIKDGLKEDGTTAKAAYIDMCGGL